MGYDPFIIKDDVLSVFFSSGYQDFIDEVVFKKGLELFLERNGNCADFPFLDTKFNPNTGSNYSSEKYRVIYTWFLGRSLESCAMHSVWLNEIKGVAGKKERLRSMLGRVIESSAEAILNILERNSGRCPFKVNRKYKGIMNGQISTSMKEDYRSAADFFCAKGLISSEDQKKVDKGVEKFKEFTKIALSGGYVDIDEGSVGSFSMTPYMLSLGAIPYLLGNSHLSDDSVTDWIGLTVDIIDTVLDRFNLTESGLLFDEANGKRPRNCTKINPGHISEFVGLGLQAVEAIEKKEDVNLNHKEEKAFSRAKSELPKILVRVLDLGYNHVHHGIFQSVDSLTGEIINKEMPWWSLPETIRAAIRCCIVADNDFIEKRLFEYSRIASNDYFSYYPNEDLKLFPFRTIDGLTGKAVDILPAVPEADPLYHTNLAFLDVKGLGSDFDPFPYQLNHCSELEI